jgi:hypothetical protein
MVLLLLSFSTDVSVKTPTPATISSISRSVFQATPGESFGIFTLRTQTRRGNILVVDNAVVPAAFEEELARECCLDNVEDRADRIRSIIRSDVELAPRQKEIGIELVSLHTRCTGQEAFPWVTFGVLLSLCGFGLAIVQFVVDETSYVWLAVGLPHFFIGLVSLGIVCACRWRAPQRIQALEQELTDARRGPVIMESLLKEG